MTTSPLSILCLHPNYELYGSDRSFLLSLKALKEEIPNAKLTVVIPKKGELSDAMKEQVGIEPVIEDFLVLRKANFKKTSVRSIFSSIQKIRVALKNARKYDLVLINDLPLLNYVFISRFVKAPVVTHVRTIPTGVVRAFFNVVIHLFGDQLIFNSIATKKAYKLLFKSAKSQKVIYNGSRGYTDLSVPDCDNELRILLLGRFNSWKGQMLMLESLRNLNLEERKKVKVRLVGDVYGNQVHFKENVLKAIQEWKLDDVVEVYPFSANPVDHISWSNVVTVPSVTPEPFGLVAIEGMSAGRLVVAANHGGLSEIIRHDVNGIHFEPCNANALNSVWRRVIETPELIQKMGSAAKIDFEERFSEKKYKVNMAKYLTGLLS